jgi:hypothetical protein
MSNEPTDLNAFEHHLAEVAPHPGGLDRDALLFAAGQAAGRRGRFWPVLCATLALVSAGLSTALVLRPARVVEVERVVTVTVEVPVPVQVPAPELAPATSDDRPPLAATPLEPDQVRGMRLRERVLREGVGVLPSTVWAMPPAQSRRPEVPDLSALRLNAPRSPGELIP